MVIETRRFDCGTRTGCVNGPRFSMRDRSRARCSTRTGAASCRGLKTTRFGFGTRRPGRRSASRFRTRPRIGAVYSPDGKRILSWSADSTLRLWDAATGAAIGEPLRNEAHFFGALYSPDGTRVLSWSNDGSLWFWDAETGAAIGKPLRHEGSVNGAVYSPDGKRILSWSNDRTLRFWDAETGAAIGKPLRHDDAVRGAVYSPDESASCRGLKTRR